MKIITMTLLLGLPLLAFAQTPDQPKDDAQKAETKTTAPATTTHPAQHDEHVRQGQQGHEERTEAQTTRPDAAVETRSEPDASRVRTQEENAREVDHTDAAAGARTEARTTVNKQEFRTRHSELFSLGRHPRDFFVQRYGERHFRQIGNGYFVFEDGCWVAVDVDGFSYTERTICQGDPDYVVVD